MMAYVKPGGRAEIKHSGEGVRIAIPARKNIPITLFLLFWLGGWFMGEVFALKGLLSGETPIFVNAFLLFWLCGWTLGGAFAFSVVAWNIAGKEIITASHRFIRVERKVLNIGLKKQYSMMQVKNLRLVSGFDTAAPQNVRRFVWNPMGTISFDYGMKTVKIASGIDEAESRAILERIKVYTG